MKCKHCKKDFYRSHKDRKYCSSSCSAKVNNKKRAKPKQKFKMKYQPDFIEKTYWNLYHNKFVTVTTMKNLMRERYVSNKIQTRYDLFVPNNVQL